MQRKEFIKICGGSCLTLLGVSLLNQSCKGTHYVQTTAINNQTNVSLNEFKVIANDKTTYRKYIVLKIDKSEYPIVIYRHNENTYQAILMRCTHQGVELNVNGDMLTCSAHGSEFSNKGEVIQGPAEQKLKIFTTVLDQNNLQIQIN